MKSLLFFRHGKSDWDADYEGDHERPLKKRGRKAAESVGRYLAAAGQVPERVVCSTAVRARQTLDLAYAAGGWQSAIVYERAVYEAEPDDLLRIVRAQPDAYERVLLIGHEPTFSQTISRLVGGGDVRVPTAAVALLRLDAARWQDVQPGDAELRCLLPPKMLPKA